MTHLSRVFESFGGVAFIWRCRVLVCLLNILGEVRALAKQGALRRHTNTSVAVKSHEIGECVLG